MKDKVIVVGMDAVALYPSITKSMASKTMYKAVKEADMVWENVNVIYL